MTVETTDYTPGGKTLSRCTPRELLLTLDAIEGHGLLRMHAAERLTNRLIEEAHSRGMGVYQYDKDDGELAEPGLRYAIVKGSSGQLKPDTHLYALTARNADHEDRVFVVNGPYSKVRAKVRAFCDAPSAYPKTEPLDLSKGPVRLPSGAIVGLWSWNE